jgi:uncharacterized membrane protein YphA (DoxX/SURF4 family)
MTAVAAASAEPSTRPATELRAAAPGRPLVRSLGFAGGAVLGLVLLVAAGLKALDPAGFAEEIVRQDVAFGLPARAAALLALALEVGLGALLLFNLRRTPVLIAATLLVAFFLFLTGRAAWREAHGVVDDSGSCGCFGALVERTPREAFVQDLLLMVPALGLAWLGRPGARRGVAPRYAAALALAAGGAGFAFAAPGLPLDDRATRLKPGVELAALCAGADEKRVCLSTLAPELAAGRHLVVIADVHDAGFDALAKRLNAYARNGSRPEITVLADVTFEQRQALFWRVAPAFVLQETPRALLRPLYRRLPRSFELEAGRVTATWAGLPETVPAENPAL